VQAKLKMRKQFLLWLILMSSTMSIGQKRQVTFQIVNFYTNKPVSNASIMLVGSSLPAGVKQASVTADEQGKFDLRKLKPGTISLLFIGDTYFEGEMYYERDDKYYGIGIINLRVSRKNKEIHLGKIYTFSKFRSISQQEVSDLPCIRLNDKNYCYQLLLHPDRLHIDMDSRK
jgi:5-hydroxyisourate hydrolase-like protein (transthyretin family)